MRTIPYCIFKLRRPKFKLNFVFYPTKKSFFCTNKNLRIIKFYNFSGEFSYILLYVPIEVYSESWRRDC
jgi:hypothetical protein